MKQLFENIEDVQFYPTPQDLIRKAFDGIKFGKVDTFLEASAGKGDVCDFVKKQNELYRKTDIDCIEIDANLRNILKGKEYRVVHDDFLTYVTMKRYDLIFLNPPFKDGDKHLLKALDIQKDGGAVIAIVNAETLKNPFTNIRKDLIRKLEEYGANVEYIENAFSSAERKTDVEIALVKVFIAEKKIESDLFENIRKAKEVEDMPEFESSAHVMPFDFMNMLEHMVRMYETEIEAGVKFIREFKTVQPYFLEKIIAPEDEIDEKGNKVNHYNDSLLTLQVGKDTATINGFIKKIRGKYWQYLLTNKKFIGRLTSSLRSWYYNKVSELVDYEFSLYNILTVYEHMRKDTVSNIENTITELFDELSTKHSWYDETSNNVHYFNGWKTNKAHKINKKVIMPFAIINAWGSKRIYEAESKFNDISKVFDYLDMGRTEDFNVMDVIREYVERGEYKKIPLKYFNLTFYKKGTTHIEFTNMELLDKFNLYGCQRKGWLPPDYGRKPYDKMDKEEKAVVKEFSGSEANYNIIVNDQNYYLVSNSQLLLD